jgi:hypothetical protein
MKLFEYAVIKEEKTDKDGVVVDPASVLVPITAVLARDIEQANMIAARAIPEAHIDDLDRITVVVRPF